MRRMEFADADGVASPGVNEIHAAGCDEVGVPRTTEVANKRLRKFRDDERGDRCTIKHDLPAKREGPTVLVRKRTNGEDRAAETSQDRFSFGGRPGAILRHTSLTLA